MALVLATEPSSLVAVEDQCVSVETWAELVTSIPDLRDASNKLAAISEYLELTSTEGRARVAAAQRRIEVRIGTLLGPAQPGNPTGANQHGGTSSATEVPPDGLSADQRSEFRRMAENPEAVEETIAASTDEAPASRRKVTQAIKRKASAPREPVDLEDQERRARCSALFVAFERLSTHGVIATLAVEEMPDELRHRIDQHLDNAVEFVLNFRAAWPGNSSAATSPAKKTGGGATKQERTR